MWLEERRTLHIISYRYIWYNGSTLCHSEVSSTVESLDLLSLRPTSPIRRKLNGCLVVVVAHLGTRGGWRFFQLLGNFWEMLDKILCLIAWEELWLVVDKMLKYGDQRLFTVKLHRPFGVSVFFLWKLHKMYLRTWVALKGKKQRYHH